MEVVALSFFTLITIFVGLLCYVDGASKGLYTKASLSRKERKLVKLIESKLNTIKIKDIQIDPKWTPIGYGHTAVLYAGDGFEMIVYSDGLISAHDDNGNRIVGEIGYDWCKKINSRLQELRIKCRGEWIEKLKPISDAIYEYNIKEFSIKIVDRIIDKVNKHNEHDYVYASISRNSVKYIMDDDRFFTEKESDIAERWDVDNKYAINNQCNIIGYIKTPELIFPVAVGPDENFESDQLSIDYYYKANK